MTPPTHPDRSFVPIPVSIVLMVLLLFTASTAPAANRDGIADPPPPIVFVPAPLKPKAAPPPVALQPPALRVPPTVKPKRAENPLLLALDYFQRYRPTGEHPPAEGRLVLKKLQHAQNSNPNDPEIRQALRLYKKRYLIHTGLFVQKNQGDRVVRRITRLGLPAYRHPLAIKGKPMHMVSAGPFSQRSQADKALSTIKKELKLNDAMIRILRK